MSTDPPRSGQFPRTGPRVHSDLLADDEAIGDQLADGLARVGIRDFAGFIRVEPYLALPAAND